jgi:ribulose-5-phosphate 4-epimerase/fuculose-1-phosphate aldolase
MAGYLSSRGWAEASAGNISVLLGPSRSPGAGSDEFPLQVPVPDLEGRMLAVTRSGSRMRKLDAEPGRDVLLLRISRGGCSLRGTSSGAKPTIEISSHVLAHLAAARSGWESSAVIHVHTPSLLTISACSRSGRTLESSVRRAHPEVDLLLGGAVRFLDYLPPGAPALALATGEAFAGAARVVVWRGHGVTGLGRNLDEACDAVEIVEAAASLMVRRAAMTGGFGGFATPARRRSKGRAR